ncbi:cytoplasmic formate dehydrogenase-associated NADPH oxidoreductase, thioredoxin-like subunit [Syntrophotalea carbinolica DSM 2380]|uniref:Cytoplasmic formate dehydrogenase-associated NADPH oxidoreductase, thioredoxin-like subunit n=1 Tax=Syntrophotalea carbinolica (strain DSM 2380 / NBRC 103641 / GraBd1) TaxID=338963 RepID=Q3A3H1_SYNC1|nr:(2Fe-2S) ferredoxin domain-containing protein [Syntrophotalea carbinolica]ABA89086.1 cytoplasmic formate dehydrogenase-associated NADPH oxidoreductase, thioredoxin-like subunit [Syntrophotalea carbinolica DSM 2380]
MAKIKSLAELQKKAEELKAAANKIKSDNVIVNVSLATCSIASGGKEAMEAMKQECAAQGLTNVEFNQVGCQTYCYAEPTVEITLPGKEPVVFGYVKDEKAKELVQKYIKNGEMVDGVIPSAYERVVF